jgi:hypothetical protein
MMGVLTAMLRRWVVIRERPAGVPTIEQIDGDHPPER